MLMELHRLDGLSATGLDNLDIQDIDYELVDDNIYEIGSLESLEGLGTVDNRQITHEVYDPDTGHLVMYVDEDENLYTFNGLEGFFKKIGRGIKKIGKFVKRAVVKPVGKAIKFVGKKVLKPAFKFVNRFLNPVTILLRNGFLLAMKTNFMKVAEKLRFGYLSTAEAKKRGVRMGSFIHLKGILGKARKIYELAGGKEKNLKRAILNGKGNRNKAVLGGFDLGSFELDDEEFVDDFERFIVQSDVETVETFMAQEEQRTVEGLGEPVSGTAIAAASGAVAGIAGLLKTVTGVFEKANKAKDEVKKFVQPFNPRIPSIRPANPRATIKAVSRFQQNIPQGVVTRAPGPFITKRSGGGFNPSITTTAINDPQNKESFLKRHGTKIVIGAAVVAVGGALYFANKKNSNSSKSEVSGLPKGKKRRDELGRFIGSGTSKKRKTSSRRKKTGSKALPKKFTPKALL